MARIRSVKPSLFSSYTLAAVPIEARYLFVGLFCEADDAGRLVDSPKRLAGAVFPHDDKVTGAKVDRWLADLARVGCISRYEAEGGRYISVPQWEAHQRISHPSPSPLPPPSGETPEKLRNHSGGNREPLRPDKERERDYPLTPTADAVGEPVDNSSHTRPRRGMRGTGTSPRERAKAAAEVAAHEALAASVAAFVAECGPDLDRDEVGYRALERWPHTPEMRTRAVSAWAASQRKAAVS